jgi:hypothetical protein
MDGSTVNIGMIPWTVGCFRNQSWVVAMTPITNGRNTKTRGIIGDGIALDWC